MARAASTINQGDICLVPFPYTDLSGTKYRPAVVISNSSVNSSGDLILAAITSKLRQDSFSYPILNEKVVSPLPKESEIRCHKIFTAQRKLIKKKITSFKDESLEELLEKVKSFLSKL